MLKTRSLPLKEQDSALIWCEIMKERGSEPTSMYSWWSSIKSCLVNINNIPAGDWAQVKSWLKSYADGTFPKSAPPFTAAEVGKFMKTAPDHKFIRHKVALTMGLNGRLRGMEYTLLFHEKNNKEKILVFKSMFLL